MAQINTDKKENTEKQEVLTLPPWVLQNPPAEPLPPKPLRPSAQNTDEDPAEQNVLDAVRLKSLQRGPFLHKLLQCLPDVEPDKRREVAFKLKPADIDSPENLFTLLENNKFKELFGPNSLAEAPIVGVLDGQVISGQIDRLVVLPDEVILVDYKSNYYVPTSVEHVPISYKKQLKTYRALLKNIFPDKVIKTYLLWIQNLTWMEIE